MVRKNIYSEMKNTFGTSNYVPGHCVMSLEYQDIDSSSLEHVTFAIYNIYMRLSIMSPIRPLLKVLYSYVHRLR